MKECKPLECGQSDREEHLVLCDSCPNGRGLHSFTIELNLSKSRTRS